MSFIVAAPAKYFFSIELSWIAFNLTHPDPNHNKHFHYAVYFDNYRTVVSGGEPSHTPVWGDNPNGGSTLTSTEPQGSSSNVSAAADVRRFVYETLYPHLLISKVCRIELFSNHVFLGDASVDLQTIATGPSRIVLTLFNGDLVVGRVSMIMKMVEVCQSHCSLKDVTVSWTTPNAFPSPKALSLVVTKRATEDSVYSDAPVTWSNTGAAFVVPDHVFALDSESMLSLTGLRFQLRTSGAILGECTVTFEDFIRKQEEESVRHTESAGLAHRDSSTQRVKPPLECVGKHPTQCTFAIEAPLTTSRDAAVPTQHPVDVTLRALVTLERSITFAQMPSGWTVDGVVVGDPMPGFVRPPFLLDEMERSDINPVDTSGVELVI